VNVRLKMRLAVVFCLLGVGGGVSFAQRGGGPPGGGMGGGGMRGNDMGGPRGEMEMGRMPGPRLRVAPQIVLPGRWWDDKKAVKSLKLRTDQQQRMDDIFNANKGNLLSLYENLQREQQRFVAMPREDLQDETKVFAEIDRVAQARADLEKASFHFQMEIRKEMDPEQVSALDKQIAEGQ